MSTFVPLSKEEAMRLAPEDQAVYLDLLEQYVASLSRNMLARYVPYPKQAQFHALGATFRERMLVAANQAGKCGTVSSYLDLPDGTRATFGELYRANKPFPVLSWDGAKVVVELAVEPIRKPAEPCVRLWFTDGSWFECALRHRMLSASGEYVFVSQLLASLPNLRESSSAHGRSTRGADAQRWTRTLRGFRVGCLAGLRFGDALLHRVEGTARALLRRQADALQHSSSSCDADACLTTRTNTASQHGRQGSGRLSSRGALGRFWGRCVASSSRAVLRCAQRWSASIQAAQRSLLVAAVGPRSGRAGFQGQGVSAPALVSPFVGGNQIIAYEAIASQEVYDFTVPATANYITNGVVHHNTYSAACEVAMHLTGQYPAWWQGKRFARPVTFLCGSESAELTRRGVQRLLLGRPEAENEWGTGTIPGDSIISTTRRQGVADAVASIVVRHVSGGSSVINLLSYDQGRTKWQADTVDGVWLDEEPPEDVYMEALTRTNVSGGPMLITFTPLKGMSSVVKRFLLDKHHGTVAVTMTIDDALHYTPQQRADIIASYPAHERDARTKGIPSMGQGRVFPLADSAISVNAFPLPQHWRRIAGIDFGWTHPTAVGWIAHDTDTDTAYLYDIHRRSEAPVTEHAAVIRGKGDWIPVAWPHDGANQTSAAGGAALADQYRAQGLNLTATRAQFPPGPDGKSGGNSLEAGAQMMLTRMQTGRLKVFAHLEPFFEEFRMYHRDENGIIVDKLDDILSAVRYALVMLRYAKTEQEVRYEQGQSLNALFGVNQRHVGMGVLDPTIGY